MTPLHNNILEKVRRQGQISSCQGLGRERGLTVKGRKGPTVVGNGNVLYLYCDGGYRAVHLSKLIKLHTYKEGLFSQYT